AALMALQWPIVTVYLALMDGSAAVEEATAGYFQTRIWGAPAALTLFACSGLLIGLGRSRELLFVQLLLNGLNAGLDIWFAGYLGMGVRGIGVGTAIAEWSTCAVALVVVWRVLRARHDGSEPFLSWEHIADGARIRQSLAANGDILIRTLCLLFAFAWFANAGARFGDVTLAANHILLQLVSFSAFFLDGFAFVAEARVGAAWGARPPPLPPRGAPDQRAGGGHRAGAGAAHLPVRRGRDQRAHHPARRARGRVHLPALGRAVRAGVGGGVPA